MSFPKFQRTAVTNAGDVVAGATVTVRSQATGLIVDPLYSDAGSTTKANPFNTLDDGFIEFFAPNGEYRVEVVGPSGTVEWTNVLLGGTAATRDVDELVTRLDYIGDLEGFEGTVDGQRVSTTSWRPGWAGFARPKGGNQWVWLDSGDKALHTGAFIVDPEAPFPTDYDNQAQVDAFLNFTGSGTGIWLVLGKSVATPEEFGFASTLDDCYTILSSMLNASDRIDLSGNILKFQTKIDLDFSGKTVCNGELKTDTLPALIDFNGCIDWEFSKVDFSSTLSQGTQDVFGLTLFTGSNRDGRFYECGWSSPEAFQNAVKIIAQNSDRMSNIRFVRPRIKDVQRMGIEVQNHTTLESVSSLTASAGVATATVTGHGFSTGDYVQIKDAVETEFNGNHQITVTGTDTFTFPVGSGAAASATGTILCGIFTVTGLHIENPRMESLAGPAGAFNHGVSLSGLVRDWSITDGYYKDVGTPGNSSQCIELVGANDGSCHGNRFDGYIGNPIAYGAGGIAERKQYDNSIYDNRCLNEAFARFQINDTAINNTVYDNHYIGADAANAFMLFACVDSQVYSNTSKCRGPLAVDVRSTRCKYHSNIWDCKPAGVGAVTGIMALSDATDNIMVNDTFDAQSGAIINRSGTNSGNRITPAFTYKDYSNITTETINPGTVNTGTSYEKTAISMPDAAIGDFVDISPPYNMQGCSVYGYIATFGEVRVVISNVTGSNKTFASGDWRIALRKNLSD